jgi:Beta-propeller repeat
MMITERWAFAVRRTRATKTIKNMRLFSVSFMFALSLYGADAAKLGELNKLPLVFEQNLGQADSQVRFLARGSGYTLFLTDREAVMSMKGTAPVRMRLVGGVKAKHVERLEPTEGISNYFLGNDPSKWRTEIPHFQRLKYIGVYPGVDLVYYGDQGKLEYDFLVAPGADASHLEIAYQGVESLRVDEQGDLLLKTAAGELRQQQPKGYQQENGKRIEVGARYRLDGGKKVGFELARYDRSKALVIDPVVVYSSYLGGSSIDWGYAIAADGGGNAYVTGYTVSVNFPTVNPLQPLYGGSWDAFVTKINSSGSAIVYSTYLGGSSQDIGNAIAVDSGGNAYVTGQTSSTNFPTVSPLQATHGGSTDAFVTKVNAAGSALIFSTYLGGSGGAFGYCIALDAAANVYVAGAAGSQNFLTSNPTRFGPGSLFVTKINAAGSALVYSAFFGGGSTGDTLSGMAVDGSANVYLTGTTFLSDFPTNNALQPTLAGASDAFVMKINSSGSALVYSTFLGGFGTDHANGIAVDASGNAYVTGSTDSQNFPLVNPLHSSPPQVQDGFLAKIDTDGSALVYSTYLGIGGGAAASGQGVAVDGAGNAYVGANTGTLPNTALAAKVDARGSAELYSIAQLSPSVAGIAVDGGGNTYMVGSTGSAFFTPVFPFQPSYGGMGDAWVSSISGNVPTAVFRDIYGGIELVSNISTVPKNSGGVFASDPGAAQDTYGNTFAVARDNFNGLWVNAFHSRGQTWAGWSFAGGSVQGTPAIAATATGAAYFVARDNYNSYWINSFTPGSGFGGWVNLGGVFATDPVIAAGSSCPGSVCTLYLVGRDNFNAVWTATYQIPGGFGGWHLQGAVASGKPSVTVGVDGAAYIAIRDTFNSVWMGRQAGSTFNGWQPGGGTTVIDPQLAGAGGTIFTMALVALGGIWSNTFTEGNGNNWTGWQSITNWVDGGQSYFGPPPTFTVAAGAGPRFFIAARDVSNELWWYETPGIGWRYFGSPGLAAGPLVAAPR